ncbi:hydroxyisourate hydrolase [Endozoicomonas sp. SM1973]|uniref:5-hydroxyisourate hydrolase n=1 Tax=Spartinivicinus marinus TaxID=2994442 RepID=A0A853HV16_9GAMM|nr:hydroxyisourate hydrolase [Spartinivicinus marinus]MCX4029519.1 hydroxyisourate hydrolase [Spartinivicinus marinus]NYZ65093.1 hydroxyisourate hydrolase [Spartinivicinus marinus]
MSQITTHVLDTTHGRPAPNLSIHLSWQTEHGWEMLAQGKTDHDGRILDLLPPDQRLPAGTYRVHFDTQNYFEYQGTTVFYPYVDIVFRINGDRDHYHIPLLLSAHGYTTYRGS